MAYAVKVMPRPKSLTPHQLATAALTVIDRDGLAALSMRAVAAELGMATMSLYRYVDGREQLEGLVVETVLAGIDLDLPPGWPWQRRIATLAVRARRAVAAHPGLVPLLMAHRHPLGGRQRWSEAVLRELTEAGFTGPVRAAALRALTCYLIGVLHTEHLGPLPATGEDHPLLAAVKESEAPLDAERRFTEGLEIILTGLVRHPG